MMNFTSYQWFLGLTFLIVLERLLELWITRRNSRRLRARGGFEAGRGHFMPMAILHTSFLIAAPLEAWYFQRPWIPLLGVTMLLLLAATMSLRYWAIVSLGDRWTARVFVVPGESPVEGGPYRWLRHPNYLAVIVEIFVFPLVHSAWLTALIFSLGNALMLRTRIQVEEQALAEVSDYEERFADRHRLLPERR